MDKNPFDYDDGKDDNNPFRSDDDDDEINTDEKKRDVFHVAESPVPAIMQSVTDDRARFPITGGKNDISNTSSDSEINYSCVKRLKPSPLPRRSLFVLPDGNETSSTPTRRSGTSQSEGPDDELSARSNNGRPSSVICATPSPKMKRKAPSVPVVITSSPTNLSISPLAAPTSPPGCRSKKPAPLPPPARRRGDSASERRKSSTVIVTVSVFFIPLFSNQSSEINCRMWRLWLLVNH